MQWGSRFFRGLPRTVPASKLRRTRRRCQAKQPSCTGAGAGPDRHVHRHGIVIVLAIIFDRAGSWAIVAGGPPLPFLITRRYYAATDIAIHYACTLVALVAYALAIVAHYPGSWLGISIGAIVFVALMIGGGLVLRTKPTWMARMADWVEMLGGVAIIPVVVMSLELW